jgi:hypothetical protein
MTEDPPVYTHQGHTLTAVQATDAELLAEISNLSIQVNRYKHALRTIAGLTKQEPVQADPADYAFDVLQQYKDHL